MEFLKINEQGKNEVRQSMTNSTKLKVGQILMNQKVISQKQLVFALAEQKRINSSSKRKFKLGEVLLICELIELKDLHNALIEQKPRRTFS